MEEQTNAQSTEDIMNTAVTTQPMTEETLVAEAEEPMEEPIEEMDELSKVMAQLEEFKAALQRERADFQNFRKRVERETEAVKAKISAEVLAKFLPVLDDFNRALEAVPAEEQENSWVLGITGIHRKFQSLLEGEGIVPIDPLGQPFDPSFHEAIGADEPSEQFASGHVTAVLQKGYMQGDRVLRPAIVRVAS